MSNGTTINTNPNDNGNRFLTSDVTSENITNPNDNRFMAPGASHDSDNTNLNSFGTEASVSMTESEVNRFYTSPNRMNETHIW